MKLAKLDLDRTDKIKRLLSQGKIVHTRRQAGKTYAIAKLLLDNPGKYVVVVPTLIQRERLEHIIKRLEPTFDLTNLVFASPAFNSVEGLVRGTDKKIIVDNLSHCFPSIDVSKVYAATDSYYDDRHVVLE
jgi:hypothetical protein